RFAASVRRDRQPHAWPLLQQLGRVDAELLEGAGTRSLDDDVRLEEYGAQPIRLGEVDRTELLAGVHSLEERRRPPAGAVGTGRRFDLDHAHTRVAEEPRAQRSGPQ